MTVTRTPREIADVIIAVNKDMNPPYDPTVEDDLRTLLIKVALLGGELSKPAEPTSANTPSICTGFNCVLAKT